MLEHDNIKGVPALDVHCSKKRCHGRKSDFYLVKAVE